MPLFIKPNGKKVFVNEDPINIAQAKKLGWELVKEEPKSDKAETKK